MIEFFDKVLRARELYASMIALCKEFVTPQASLRKKQAETIALLGMRIRILVAFAISVLEVLIALWVIFYQFQ